MIWADDCSQNVRHVHLSNGFSPSVTNNPNTSSYKGWIDLIKIDLLMSYITQGAHAFLRNQNKTFIRPL